MEAGPAISAVEADEGEALASWLAELSAIERPSASAGERRAAEWIHGRFAELGAEARIESERAHGTYWWPLGIGAGAAAAANLAALRGHRLAAAGLGAAAGAALVDEFPPGKRRLRNRLPSAHTYNVICELGPADAERTIVLVAHHDAAHSGLIFHPAIPETIFRRLGVPIELFDTSPALMWPLLASPALAVAAGLTGSRLAARLGAVLGAGYAAAMAEIGSRAVVPGANDNATAVVLLLAIARRLRADPTSSLRVILLSTGSEESFSEGMKAFGDRHFDDLPRESTFFLCVDTLGSPTLNVLRGEGFVRMHEYPRPVARAPRRPRRGARDRAGPEPAPAQRHRRPRAARRRLPDRDAVLGHRPQTARQLPLADRRRRERRPRDGGECGALVRGDDPPPRRALARGVEREHARRRSPRMWGELFRWIRELGRLAGQRRLDRLELVRGAHQLLLQLGLERQPVGRRGSPCLVEQALRAPDRVR